MVLNLAHRGASEYAPENTLAAFYKAIELESAGIEMDIQRTMDGHLVIFHDDVVDEKTDGKGPVSSYRLNELKQLDAGSWFSPVYKGERIITFEEFLHFFGRRELVFAFELKVPDIEQQTLELINRYGIRDKTTITSFHYDYLANMRRLDSTISLGHLVEVIDMEAINRLKDIQATQICPNANLLHADQVSLARQHNFNVRAWKVTDTSVMMKAIDCGADGMTVNFPDKLNEVLRGLKTISNG